jgi:Bacterial sugar transferase
LLNVMNGTMSLVGPRPHPPNTKAAGRLFNEVVQQYALIVLGACVRFNRLDALRGGPKAATYGFADTCSAVIPAFNSLRTTIAPFLGGLLILDGAPKSITKMHRLLPAELHAYRLQEAASVKLPYLGLALATRPTPPRCPQVGTFGLVP